MDIGNHVPSSISIAEDLQKRERNFLLDDYDYMTGGEGGFCDATVNVSWLFPSFSRLFFSQIIYI